MSVDFTKIIAWQKAHQYVLTVYSVSRKLPDVEKHGLYSQFTRAAVSIAANIAEGCQKISKADKLRFLNISQGSLSECKYYNLLIKDLGYISATDFQQLSHQIDIASYFLNMYIEGIENNNAIQDS